MLRQILYRQKMPLSLIKNAFIQKIFPPGAGGGGAYFLEVGPHNYKEISGEMRNVPVPFVPQPFTSMIISAHPDVIVTHF